MDMGTGHGPLRCMLESPMPESIAKHNKKRLFQDAVSGQFTVSLSGGPPVHSLVLWGPQTPKELKEKREQCFESPPT